MFQAAKHGEKGWDEPTNLRLFPQSMPAAFSQPGALFAYPTTRFSSDPAAKLFMYLSIAKVQLQVNICRVKWTNSPALLCHAYL